MSSGSAVAMTLAPASTRNLGGSSGADADHDSWKTERVLGSSFMDGRYGFLLRRLSRGGVPDLKFDRVSGCCTGLISSTVKASLLVSHLEVPQSCISAMEARRARMRR